MRRWFLIQKSEYWEDDTISLRARRLSAPPRRSFARRSSLKPPLMQSLSLGSMVVIEEGQKEQFDNLSKTTPSLMQSEKPVTKSKIMPRLTVQEKKIFTEKMTSGGFGLNASGKIAIKEVAADSNAREGHPSVGKIASRRFSVGSLLMAKARAREAFQMLDRNGDGFLRKEDVFEALTMLHFDERFNEAHESGDDVKAMEVVELMISEIDKDGDGKIDLEGEKGT